MPEVTEQHLLRRQVDEPVLADAPHRLDARADAGALEPLAIDGAPQRQPAGLDGSGCARRPAAAAACAPPSRPRAAQASSASRRAGRTPRPRASRRAACRRCRRSPAPGRSHPALSSDALPPNSAPGRCAGLAPLVERGVHHRARSARRRPRRGSRRPQTGRCAAPPSRPAAPARTRPRGTRQTSLGSPYSRTITESAPYSLVPGLATMRSAISFCSMTTMRAIWRARLEQAEQDRRGDLIRQVADDDGRAAGARRHRRVVEGQRVGLDDLDARVAAELGAQDRRACRDRARWR